MNPRAYANGLKLQNQHIHDRYIVPVTGITEAMMLHMQPHLKDIKGVHDVFPTQQTQARGRWNVIVDKALFASTRHEIEKALLAITAKVSANVIPPAEFAAIPTIQARTSNAPTLDTSYLQTSARSFSSIEVDSRESDIKKPRTVYGFKSWSEIVQPNATSPSTAEPPHLPPRPSTARPESADAHLFEQLDAQKKQIKVMQEQINKLETLILLLTQKLESTQSLEKTRPPHLDKTNNPLPTTPHQTSKPALSSPASDAIMDDTPKRTSSEVTTTPPLQQQSKQQKPTTSPRALDNNINKDKQLQQPVALPCPQILLRNYFRRSKAAVVE